MEERRRPRGARGRGGGAPTAPPPPGGRPAGAGLGRTTSDGSLRRFCCGRRAPLVARSLSLGRAASACRAAATLPPARRRPPSRAACCL